MMTKKLTCQKTDVGYLVRLMQGTRVTETLGAFFEEEGISAGVISAIGALEAVELGYFDRAARTYLRKTFSEIYELVSFTGNISLVDGVPFMHAHAILSNADYTPIAGHFFDATVAVTMEAYIQPFSVTITREPDETTGLKLLKLPHSR